MNIFKVREQELSRLKAKVNSAFEHRLIIENKKEVEISYIRKHDDDWINIKKSDFCSSEVYVENSHLYPYLLKFAYNTMASKLKLPIDEKKYEIDCCIHKDLKHEYEHSVPLLGLDSIKLMYGVQFVEHKRTKTIGLIPMIEFSGLCQIKILKDSIMAPEDLSNEDKLIIEKIIHVENETFVT